MKRLGYKEICSFLDSGSCYIGYHVLTDKRYLYLEDSNGTIIGYLTNITLSKLIEQGVVLRRSTGQVGFYHTYK